MKVVFLNTGYVEALKAYGVTLNGTEGLPDLSKYFTYVDMATIQLQTDRLIHSAPFSNMGLTSAVGESHEDKAVLDRWDVFLKEGGLTQRETLQRLKSLGCVVSENHELIFFETAEPTGDVFLGALRALEKVMPLNDVMQTSFWKQKLKSF